MPIHKAVIPAAGLGTRFLPASKAVPKELLPIIDRPTIHYVVEEALDSGIDHIIIITSRRKEALSHYFRPDPEMERDLETKGKVDALMRLADILKRARFTFIHQERQLGLGHAVLQAKEAVGNEPFAVLLPDDVIVRSPPALAQMIHLFERYQASVVAVKEISEDRLSDFGVILPKKIQDRLYEVLDLVEKPSRDKAPSRLGIVGRYVLTPEIFDELGHVTPGAIGEIQLTDGMALLRKRQKLYAYRFEGTHYDCGTPLGLLKTSVEMALKREDLGAKVREWLKGLSLE